MLESIVQVRNLTRRYGRQMALDGIDIELQPGLVYGLVGANGAGKTTLIKHLLGLLRPQQGSVRVFGLDPVTNPVAVLQRIGYLSEERELPEWMRIEELLRYTAAFHPKWEPAYAEELLGTFRLDPGKKIKHLSKGMRAQAGLIAAVAHRPDLLLLDEPSTGLDPIVRKDILNAILRTVAEEGRTAIFSSHLLDEVELMSDYVTMFHRGRVVLHGTLDEVKKDHLSMTIRLESTAQLPAQLDQVLSAEQRGGERHVVCRGSHHQVVSLMQATGTELVSIRNATLQEIFVGRAGREVRCGTDRIITDHAESLADQ